VFNIVATVTLFVHDHLGFTTQGIRRLVVDGNRKVLAKLRPVCTLRVVEPGSPERRMTCCAYNGDTAWDLVLPNTPFFTQDKVRLEDHAARNTSYIIAKAMLATLYSRERTGIVYASGACMAPPARGQAHENGYGPNHGNPLLLRTPITEAAMSRGISFNMQALLLSLFGSWLTVAAVQAATPVQIAHFASSSGQTDVVYFTYQSGPCGGGVACHFRGTIAVPAGFQTAEVFLSGFRLQTANTSDLVRSVGATVHKYRYDQTTGDLEVGVTAWLWTQSGQQYSYLLTFTVLLTSPGMAQFTHISTGCSGVGECHIVQSLPAAVPAGMHYIGVATYNWHLGASSGPPPLHILSGHLII
jgi:hypothetical protein